MNSSNNTELSSPEETRPEFNSGESAIKLGIDVHQHFYVVVLQVGGTNPKPAQRFQKEAFLGWAGKLAREKTTQFVRRLRLGRLRVKLAHAAGLFLFHRIGLITWC